MATHAGMTTEEFEQIVTDWIATAKHPKTGRLYTEMVYQPMLELLAYLRANGFKTFIVSGGGIEFMRPWAERVYGIPPEQVVGSSIKTKFELRDGKPVLVRLPEIELHRRQGRQAGRHPAAHRPPPDRRLRQLRRRPPDARSGRPPAPAPRFGLIVHHTDAEREWAYDRESPIGRLDRGARRGRRARLDGRRHEEGLETRLSGPAGEAVASNDGTSARRLTQPPPTLRGVLMRWKPCVLVADRFQGW